MKLVVTSIEKIMRKFAFRVLAVRLLDYNSTDLFRSSFFGWFDINFRRKEKLFSVSFYEGRFGWPA